MVKCYRKPILLSDFWVTSHDRVSDFYTSAWQRGDSPIPMFGIRLVLALISFSILMWSVVEAPNKYWLLYLTNWGTVLLTLALLSGTVVCLAAASEKNEGTKRQGIGLKQNEERYSSSMKKESTKLPWYISTYWFLYNIGMSMGLMISALYWILLYDPNLKSEMGLRFFLLELSTHGINSCLIMTEILTSRVPVRFLHFYQPMGIGLWYAIFSDIYYVSGGKDINGFPFIYNILDWRHPKRTIVVVIASAIALLLIYTLVFLIANARDKLSLSPLKNTTVKLSAPPRMTTMHAIARNIVDYV